MLPLVINSASPTDGEAEDVKEEKREAFSDLAKASTRAVENLQAASLAVESFYFSGHAGSSVLPF